MGHIGDIVSKCRLEAGISRRDLAANICTEKYVYLIERDLRTPSAEMLRQFEERLGADLFQYYPYLDCADPVGVCRIMARIDLFRRKSDLDGLKEVTELAARLPDFGEKPWSFEIELNRLAVLSLSGGRHAEAIRGLRPLIDGMRAAHAREVTLANAYVMLSTCCQCTGELDEAKRAVAAACRLVCTKHPEIRKYDQVASTVWLNTLTLCYLTGEYERAVRVGTDLLRHQFESNSYEWCLNALFFTSFCYYRLRDFPNAFDFFRRGLHASLIEKKATHIRLIRTQPLFDAMLRDSRTDPSLVREFLSYYEGPEAGDSPPTGGESNN